MAVHEETAPRRGSRIDRRLRGSAGFGLAVVFALLLVGHPASRGELGELARLQAEIVARPWELVARSVSVVPGIAVAIGALFLGVAYIATFGVVWLGRPAGELAPADADRGGRSAVLSLSAALLSHASATIAVLAGGGLIAFYGWGLGTGTVALGVIAWTSRGLTENGSRRRPERRPAAALRAIGVGASGLLLMFASSALDQVSPILLDVPMLPDLSFVLAELFRALGHGRSPGVGHLACGALLVAVAALLPVATGHDNARPSILRASALAAVVALLLAPSNPARALALGFTDDRLRAMGVGAAGRAAFLLSAVIAFAIPAWLD